MSDRPRLRQASTGYALAKALFAVFASRAGSAPKSYDASGRGPAPAAMVARGSARPAGVALPPIPTQRLFGIAVAELTRAEVVARIIAWAGRPPTRIVITANLDHVMKLRGDPRFAAAYRDADLVTADGMPFVWLSRREGRPLAERVAGSDLILPVAKAAARARRSLFLFGSTRERLAAAAAVLRRAAPRLVIAGAVAPPFGFERDEATHAELVALLRRARPDIVLVALGAPKQELWSHRMARELDTGVFLNIGAGLDFIAGEVRRAPRPLRTAGLEWAWRALSEPRRLGPRYARIAAALPALYAMHRHDLAAVEAERLRREMAAATDARVAVERAQRGAAGSGGAG